jgi:PhzF family phenazine biosynthesis protein
MTFILAKQPDLESLGKVTQNLVDVESVYTSYQSLDEGYRAGLVASYFYVDLGIDENGMRQVRTRMFSSREDPGTGSAASALCSYLSLADADTNGPLVRKYQITQGVELGRQSNISLQVTVNSSRTTIEEVLLSGAAVKVAEGKISIPDGKISSYLFD